MDLERLSFFFSLFKRNQAVLEAIGGTGTVLGLRKDLKNEYVEQDMV